jgi:RNA polymerase sigma-70 factor (ECF subfamily)
MAEPRLPRQVERSGAPAFEQIVEENYPVVWRLCAALVGEPAADDVAQEAFLRAARSVQHFRGDSSTRTWMLAIARRTSMDHLRRRYRRQRAEGRFQVIAREPQPAAQQSSHLTIKELLATLEPDRRAAFMLTQLLGLSYGEAAVVCDCPVGTIRSRVARARSDLIEQLQSARASGRSART